MYNSSDFASLPEPSGTPLLHSASPLRFTATFAAICTPATTSVTMGDGVAAFGSIPGVPSSGELSLVLRWSDGFELAGPEVGDQLDDHWSVTGAERTTLTLAHGPLSALQRSTRLPILTIVKRAGVNADDTFVVSLCGADEFCRQRSLVGWAYR